MFTAIRGASPTARRYKRYQIVSAQHSYDTDAVYVGQCRLFAATANGDLHACTLHHRCHIGPRTRSGRRAASHVNA
jgi:hypothetical protein